MNVINSLKNSFLIAMPTLKDPHFFRTVTYICEHDSEGALGIIINQPLDVHLGDILEQMDIITLHPHIADRLVFSGGPLHKERGFILHPPGEYYQNTIELSHTIALTTSPDILEDIGANKGPDYSLIALGYAHWDAGQLEKELATNTWLYGPASNTIIFHMAIEQRWKAAVALMGVDVERLSETVGHA